MPRAVNPRGFRFTRISRHIVGLLAVVTLVLFIGRPARADNIDSLSHALRTDSSYKVRIQAALVLGKLGNRNAVAALRSALSDNNNMVRAVAAQALGKIGAPEAVKDLRAALQREKNQFAKNQMQTALAILSKAGTSKGRATIYIALGPFSGGGIKPDDKAIFVVKDSLQKRLSKLPGVTFDEPNNPRDLAKNGMSGFLIDGIITRLDERPARGLIEVNCDVKLQVFRWPTRSLISFTSAGAAVQTGSRSNEKENGRRDCLQATAEQLGDDLNRFFKSQGG